MRKISGEWAVLFTAILWSTSGLFIKFVDWHPVVVAGARSFFAILTMLAFRFFRCPAKFNLRLPVRSGAFWAGGICYSATMVLFVIANKLTTSANVILLQYTAPVWTALLAWFIIKEKPRAEHWFAMLLVGGGLVLFFKDSLGNGSLAGDLIAIASGIVFAGNSVFLRMMKEGDPADAMILAHILTLVFTIPFLFTAAPVFNLKVTLAIVFMGVIQIGVASILFGYGMKHVSAVGAMLILPIEPILNPIWVLIVTKETPLTSAIIGGIIIIAAVLLSNIVGVLRSRNHVEKNI
jgi:drug/metabolite transporter (DMT)-like permease